ncbi:hypothetical protein Tco_1188174 [Tanacetum coccineum]
MTKDPAPVAADFNSQDYTTLVAHPSLFWKFPEEFLSLVGLSRHYTLDEETYPRFLDKDGEGGTTVPLLSVAPDRAESELEASVDKLFDEGGSGNQTEQGGSAGSGRGADIQLVSEATDIVAEDVAPLLPRRQRKRKIVVVGAGEASHPPKKLMEDHRTPSEPSIAGKSRSAVQRLLVGAVLNTDVRGFVISSDSSHHSGANVAEAKVDSLIRSFVPVMTVVTIVTSTVGPALVVKEKPVKPSLFSADSSSAGGADPNTSVFSDLSGNDFLVGGILTVIDPDTNLQKIYVPQWSVTNRSRLDDDRVCRDMVDEFAPLKFFASVRGMEHDQLIIEFNVGATRQMSLSAEVRMRAEYNVKERRRLKFVVEKKDELLKVRERGIVNLKVQLLLREAKATEAIRLCAEASNFKTVEKSLRVEVIALKERNTILKKERNTLDVKATDLEASVIGKERELTGFNAQLTSVKS